MSKGSIIERNILKLSLVTSNIGIQRSERSQAFDLRKMNIYSAVLSHIHKSFSALKIASDAGRLEDGATHMLYSHKCRTYTSMNVGGICYGASSHAHGEGSCYAYAGLVVRQACRIEDLLTVSLHPLNKKESIVQVDLVVISFFKEASPDVSLPWDAWCVLIYHMPSHKLTSFPGTLTWALRYGMKYALIRS